MPITFSMSRRAGTLLLAARIALVAGVVLYTVRTVTPFGHTADHFLDNWFYDGLLFVAAIVCASRRFTATDRDRDARRRDNQQRPAFDIDGAVLA